MQEAIKPSLVSRTTARAVDQKNTLERMNTDLSEHSKSQAEQIDALAGTVVRSLQEQVRLTQSLRAESARADRLLRELQALQRWQAGLPLDLCERDAQPLGVFEEPEQCAG